MLKVWEEGGLIRRSRHVFLRIIENRSTSRITNMVVVRYHQRGSAMAMQSLTKGNSTGDDVWMSRYNAYWSRAA
jgi:hypothetical protein